MAKKTYRTFYLKNLQLLLKDENGKRMEVVFRGGIQVDSTSRFSTSDEKLQQMIENCFGFNKDYYLESVSESSKPVAEEATAPKKEKEKEPEKPLTDVKDIKRFHNIVEMRNYMAELGFEGVQNMNYMQAKAAASKAGYDFKISKA